jgi:uncharacterized membrane protein (DUF373 family)
MLDDSQASGSGGGRPPARDSHAAEAWTRIFESAIYIIAAALLVVAAALTVAGAITDLIEGSDSRSVTDAGVFILERILLLFIFAELLYTLRAVNIGGRILVEPFLFIGLIAVVRRTLVITAEFEHGALDLDEFVLETGGLAGLALAFSISIYLLRRSAPPGR